MFGEQADERLSGLGGDLDLVPGQEGVEFDRQPGIQRYRAGALGARQLRERRPDVGIPQHLEAQFLAVESAGEGQSRRRRLDPVLDVLQAALGGRVQMG